MQFADSAGNIAAGALIQRNTFYFSIFLEVEACFMLQANANTYVTLFERVICPPFV
jgi:hypothetical protein